MGYIIEGILRAVELIASLNPEVIDITILSLEVSGVAVLLAALVGIPLGTWITLNEFPMKNALKNVIFTLMGLPPVVAGLVVYLLISRAGPLGTFGVLFTPTAMVIAQFVLVTPIITGLTITATKAVDKTIIDTVISLGANKVNTAIIVLNEARQAIIVAILAGFGRAIAEVGAVMIVGGDIRWSTRVLTTSIVLETRKGDYGMAIALGIILLSVSFIINMIMNMKKGGSSR
ncbi:tungstate transporter permease [Methanocella sp. CWC-04]|uniref:Tungstate transporter permease n=1 Tax=Methanooceanicella nereidis TaxID=2052831 RepID=A0AAP2RC41_9EURY|nr:ABC transporter permease [Methanocella sp. CWC-04]MCD1294519.1 tungstate transporter permease [Methanocella sp. CWC-04]